MVRIFGRTDRQSRLILSVLFALATIVLAGNSSSALNPDPVRNYRVELPGGGRAILPAIDIRGREYLNVRDIAGGLFRRAEMIESGTAIRLDEGILRCPSVSFYLALESTDGVRVAQMTHPSIERDEKIYIPAEPFFRALHVLGLFNVIHSAAGEYQLNAPPHVLSAAGAPDDFSPGPVRPAPEWREPLPSPSNRSALELSTPDHYRLPPDLRLRESATSDYFDVPPVLHERESGTVYYFDIPPDQLDDGRAAYPRQPFFETPVRAYDSLSAPPGRNYILPPDLKRREVIIDSSRSALPVGVQASPLLASLLDPALLTAPVNITDVKAETVGNTIKLRFEAGSAISSYQRPEINGTRLIIRFPETGHDAPSWQNLPDNDGIAAVAQENIRGIQVYRLRFNSAVVDVQHRRVAPTVIEFSVQLQPQGDANERLARESEKWKLDVIVIDPGHGGKDPGAIGVSGVREKDVVLNISLALGKLIEQNMPGTKVVYTRDDDTFIELYRRGQIANEAGGKLFISVHANSTASTSKTARGFETFILRPGRNEDAVKVAERENAVIKFEQNVDRYKTLTDEEFIVVNMAQKAFVKLSEKFAEMLQEEIGKATPLNNRGVNQAGFFVLVGASMPNVLFETAFLSNDSDEKYLASKKGVNDLAQGMFNSIVRYRDYLQEATAAGN